MNFNDMVSGPILWLGNRVASCPTSAMLYAILMSCRVRKNERIPTAMTNGADIDINPNFMGELDPKSRVCLLSHEAMHIMLKHVQNAKRELHPSQMRAANYLMDVYINEWIKSQFGFTLTRNGEQFGIYLNTPKLWKDDKIPYFDPLQHDWTYLIPFLNREATDGSGGAGIGDASDIDLDGASEAEADAERVMERASNVLRDLHRKHKWGNVPGWMERLLEDNNGVAKVSWRDELFDAMKTSVPVEESYRRLKSPYKFFRAAVPTTCVPSVGPIVVVTDTSGSMGVEQLACILPEVRGMWQMMKPERIHSIFCDAEINNVEEIEPDSPFVFTPKGGGGTSFRPPFQWVEDNNIEPSYLIYFTDGYGDFPDEEPGYPVIWVRIGDDSSRNFPFGRVITVEV
jgi:predicted metal-dependent peptidase